MFRRNKLDTGGAAPARGHRWIPALRRRQGPTAESWPVPDGHATPTLGTATPTGSVPLAAPAPCRGSGTEAEPGQGRSGPEVVLPLRSPTPAAGASGGSREVSTGPAWTHLPSPDHRFGLTGVERRRARQAIRKALDWHGKFVIAHIGTMGLRQSPEELVPALRHLAGVQPDVLVSFLGDGTRRAAMVRSTTGLPNVEIRGTVPEDHRLAVMLAADLLLLSERGAGAGAALGEYLPSGRPVLAVVDPGGATAEEIGRSGAGLVVTPDDPLGFTATVAMLRADPDSRTRLGDAGMRYAESRPSPQEA